MRESVVISCFVKVLLPLKDDGIINFMYFITSVNQPLKEYVILCKRIKTAIIGIIPQ